MSYLAYKKLSFITKLILRGLYTYRSHKFVYKMPNNSSQVDEQRPIFKLKQAESMLSFWLLRNWLLLNT